MKDKILFISLSNIGDAIMTTPVLEFLHSLFPNMLIDIVCDSKSKDVFIHCPYVDKILIKNKKKGLLGNIKLLLELRKINYKIAVDLRTDIFLFFIRAEKKFFKVKNNQIHSVEKHFLSLKCGKKDIPDTKLWIPKKSREKASKILKNLPGKILVLGLGANSNHKIWPVENYIDLVSHLNFIFKSVVLVGNNQDRLISKNFIKDSKISVLNLCGNLTLIESAAIISQGDYFIGNDSGLGHIASAVGTASFTLFDKEDPFRYCPWGKKATYYQSREKNIKCIKTNDIINEIIDHINYFLL